MATLPPRFIYCKCGKLILLNALGTLGYQCPKCGEVVKYDTFNR